MIRHSGKKYGVYAFAVVVTGTLLMTAFMWLISSAHAGQRGGQPARIEKVTFDASIPISASCEGTGKNYKVFFDNNESGVLTATFSITGTSPVSFTSGSAFGITVTKRITALPYVLSVVYPISTADRGNVNPVYTVSNVLNTQPYTIAVSYIQDVTPPRVSLSVSGRGGTLSLHGEGEDSQSGIVSYTLEVSRLLSTRWDVVLYSTTETIPTRAVTRTWPLNAQVDWDACSCYLKMADSVDNLGAEKIFRRLRWYYFLPWVSGPQWYQAMGTPNLKSSVARYPDYCGSKGEGVWYGGERSPDISLWKSSDGVRWSRESSMPYIFSVIGDETERCNRVFVASWGEGVVIWADGNLTKTRQPNLYLTSMAVVTSTSTLFAGSEGGVYTASIESDLNDENSWYMVSDGVITQGVRSMLYAPPNLLVGTTKCRVYSLDLSTGNVEWKGKNVVPADRCQGAAVWSLAAKGNTWFAGLDRGLGVFEKRNRTDWRPIGYFRGHTLFGMVVDGDNLYVSSDKGVARCVVQEDGNVRECNRFDKSLPKGISTFELDVGRDYIVLGTNKGFWYHARQVQVP